jgi:hypothetical protein
MAALRTFSDDDIRELRSLLRWKQGLRLGLPGHRPQLLPPPPPKYGKVDADWTTGTATVSIWTWNGSAWEDSTENETATMPPWITTWSLASGAWVKLDYHAQSGQWHAMPMVSQAVYTAWQYNASSDDVEKKTRTVVGPFTDAETDWTKVDDTNPCA